MALNRVPNPNWKPTVSKEVGEGIEYDRREFIQSLEEIKVLHVKMANILNRYDIDADAVRHYFDAYGQSVSETYEKLIKQGK